MFVGNELSVSWESTLLCQWGESSHPGRCASLTRTTPSALTLVVHTSAHLEHFFLGWERTSPLAASSSFLLSSPHTVTTLSSATACWFCLESSCKCGHTVCTRQRPTVSTEHSVGNTTHCHIVCLSVAESQCTVYLGQARCHLQSQSDLQLGSMSWGSHVHIVCWL